MHILVYIETYEGGVRKSALELLSYASELKKEPADCVTALTGPQADDNELACMAKYGADKILVVKGDDYLVSPYSSEAEVIRQAAEREGSDILLFTGSVAGKALAPVVAAKLKAGMVPGVYSMPLSLEPFTIHKRVFSGKAIATVNVKTPVKVLILLPNAYKVTENQVPLVTEMFEPAITEQTGAAYHGIRIVDTIKANYQTKLSEAGIVVSGGRGLNSKDNWRYVEELAVLLGGATACSRPAYDEGWCPHDGYVGQTGKVISPNVYFALGISGAIQHLAGISSSRLIIAVNKDPEAPIFKTADFGIVGDIQDVMPRLIKAVKEYKSSKQTY